MLLIGILCVFAAHAAESSKRSEIPSRIVRLTEYAAKKGLKPLWEYHLQKLSIVTSAGESSSSKSEPSNALLNESIFSPKSPHEIFPETVLRRLEAQLNALERERRAQQESYFEAEDYLLECCADPFWLYQGDPEYAKLEETVLGWDIKAAKMRCKEPDEICNTLKRHYESNGLLMDKCGKFYTPDILKVLYLPTLVRANISGLKEYYLRHIAHENTLDLHAAAQVNPEEFLRPQFCELKPLKVFAILQMIQQNHRIDKATKETWDLVFSLFLSPDATENYRAFLLDCSLEDLQFKKEHCRKLSQVENRFALMKTSADYFNEED